MKTGRENTTKVRNLKTIGKLHARVLKHDLGAIKCKKRGLSRRRLKETECSKFKVLDIGKTSVQRKTLDTQRPTQKIGNLQNMHAHLIKHDISTK